MKENSKIFFRGVLNSYSQIFFSDNKVFSVLLIIVSFADIYAGIAGLASVLVTNLTGILLGFEKKIITKGVYGFNSLLVGLCLGIYFTPGVLLTVIIVLAAVTTLLIAVSMQGIIGKYGLPYLSVPFLISAWILTSSLESVKEVFLPSMNYIP